MKEWLEAFYTDPDLRRTLLDSFLPVFSNYVSEATGGPVAASFVQALAEGYVDRHLGSSRAQLQELVGSSEKPLEALAARFDEWEEKRPEKVAKNELIRSANAAQVQKFREAGVEKMIWRASGGACPFCNELDGVIISVTGTFFEKGGELAPEGVESPIQFQSTIGHPPVHQGCTCFVEAVTETETADTAAPYNSVDEMPQEVRDLYRSGGVDSAQGDTQLRVLTDAQGFTGKPRVVSDAELDRLVANGEIEFWRGVSKPSYADDWRNGETVRHGTGYYGNGTYAAVGRGIEPPEWRAAQGYRALEAREVADAFAGTDGAVVRGTISADARVLTVSTRGTDLNYLTPEDIWSDLSAAERQMDSITHIAAARGYDAVLVEGLERMGGELGGDQLVILNRGAIRLSEANR